MRLHRFYVENVELTHTFWLHDERLLNQWYRVLRYQAGDQLVLFDGLREDRQYRLLQLDDKSAHLELVTELVRNVPHNEVYLFWSLLKKEKNDWVLQKATELGVSHFVPIITERTEKTGFEEDRARKIIIEAAEQCGRSDIPTVREPLVLRDALQMYDEHCHFVVMEQSSTNATDRDEKQTKSLAVLIGPEGGWSVEEKELFESMRIESVSLGQFTLRAETAVLAAALWSSL